MLDSYAEERVPFALSLVKTTDRFFEFISSNGPRAARLRVSVAPFLMTRLFSLELARRFLFKTVSQIKVSYRGSRLSEGSAAMLRGGDRLPWVTSERGIDNFESLTAPGWHAHVYGTATASLAKFCQTVGIHLDVFAWGRSAEKAGLVRDAVYLVRPDGYLGFVSDSPQAHEQLARYFNTVMATSSPARHARQSP